MDVATREPGRLAIARSGAARTVRPRVWQKTSLLWDWLHREAYGAEHRLGVGELAWLGLCLLWGGWLRFAPLSTYSLWHDELYMLITSRRPFIQGLLQQEDYAAPLYELLVRALDHGTGQPEWVLRAPAFIAGCLCIVAGWWLARSLFGRVVAGLTAFFIAINPIQVAVSYEARPYTFFALFSTLSFLFFHRLMKSGGRLNAVCYVASSLLLVYSHYYGLLCIGAEFVFGVLAMIISARARQHRRQFMVAMLVVGVGVLPALWLIVRFLGAGMPATEGIAGGGFEHWLNLMDHILSSRHLAVLFLIPFIAALWPTQTAFDRGAPADGDDARPSLEQWFERRWPSFLLALWLVFGMWLLALAARFYKPGVLTLRYLIPMAIPFLILGFAYVAKVKQGALIVAAGLLLIMNVTSHEKFEWSNDGMRRLAEYLNSADDLPQKMLLTEWAYCPDFINPEEVGLRYYGFSKRPLVKLSMAFPADKHDLRNPDDLFFLNADELRSHERIWVVSFSGYGGKVEQYLRKEGIAYDSQVFGPYHLYRVQGN